MELSFLKGENVVLTRRIDKNWFEGRVGSRKGILPMAYVDILTEPGEGTLPPPTKPAAAPAAHSILKNGSLPQSSYLPQYEKPKSTLGSTSPYSTLSRPGSSMSNGTSKPEPTPFRALYNYKSSTRSGAGPPPPSPRRTSPRTIGLRASTTTGRVRATSRRSGLTAREGTPPTRRPCPV